MKNIKIFIGFITAIIFNVSAAMAQDQPDGGELVWNSDIQPFYKCQNESGWAHNFKAPDYTVECISYPNTRGETWKVVATHWQQNSGGNKIIRLDIKKNGRSVFQDKKIWWANRHWQRDYACTGAPFGSEPRARSRDCFNQLMQIKNQFGVAESRKNILAMTGPRFDSIQRVTLAPGFDRAGGQYASYAMSTNENAEDCRAKCISDKSCKVFTYAPGICHLKAGGNSAHASPTVTSGRKW